MNKVLTIGVPVLSLLFFTGCGSSDSENTTSENSVEEVIETETDSGSTDEVSGYAVDTTKFDSSASITEVSCTLSNGESSTCYSITVSGFPSDRSELGPFCPESTSTEAVDAGKWFDDGVLYDLTGEFVSNLDSFYGDSNWQLFDEATGAIISLIRKHHVKQPLDLMLQQNIITFVYSVILNITAMLKVRVLNLPF